MNLEGDTCEKMGCFIDYEKDIFIICSAEGDTKQQPDINILQLTFMRILERSKRLLAFQDPWYFALEPLYEWYYLDFWATVFHITNAPVTNEVFALFVHPGREAWGDELSELVLGEDFVETVESNGMEWKRQCNTSVPANTH